MSSSLYPGVPVFEIREAGGMTDMLIGNRELGAALAKVLGDKNVALMRGQRQRRRRRHAAHGGFSRGLYRGHRSPAGSNDRAGRADQLPRSRGGRKGDAGSGKHPPARLGHLEANGAQGRAIERDPEKWGPVFGKDHAPTKMLGARGNQHKAIVL